LIVDQLMLRDFQRVTETDPQSRRQFLQHLAIFLSSRDHAVATEEEFRDLVSREFRHDWTKHPREAQAARIEQLFSDLRSSTTLTRGGVGSSNGWRFSHNSLREYLVAEALVDTIKSDRTLHSTATLSDVMKLFASSIGINDLEELKELLATRWKQKPLFHTRGQLLDLLITGFCHLEPSNDDPMGLSVKTIAGDPPTLSGCRFVRTSFLFNDKPAALARADFSSCVLSEVSFQRADLTEAIFSAGSLDDVDFSDACLAQSDFSNAFLANANFCGTDVRGADFRNVDQADIAIFGFTPGRERTKLFEGYEALGYLNFNGALTIDMDPVHILRHHDFFPIFDQIVTKLSKQTTHQARGLSQRGVAHQGVYEARNLLDHLKSVGYLVIPRNRKDLVEVTEKGRGAFSAYAETGLLTREFLDFFSKA
jgi:hypothetical protein